MKSPELTATTAPTLVTPQERDRPSGSKMHLVRELLSPYRLVGSLLSCSPWWSRPQRLLPRPGH